MTDTPAEVLRKAAEALERAGDDDILYMPEVAIMVNRPVETLRSWRYHKTGPPAFKVGGRVAYRRGALRAWLREQEAAATGDAA